MTGRLARRVSVRRLAGPETVAIEASESERAALAESLDLVALDRLTADLTVRPWRGDGVRIAGTVRAELTQSCVVTLEPVAGRVEETVDVRLHPEVTVAPDVDVDPEAEDPPEPLESDTLDIGAIALEHFVLGIDPYPRAPGAAFAPVEEADEEERSPFAALAKLKSTLK